MDHVRARPMVVAHRGASDDLAEHTLAAYMRAIDDGADALECDVRLTRDGVLVCVHDRRIDRTSNGRGVVSALELADLHELNFGSWHDDIESPDDLVSDRWDAPDWDRTRVLTLERLIETIADAPRPVQLAIETKHPTRYAGIVERRLVDLLRRYGLTEPGTDGRWPVRVMSFAAISLRRLHTMEPGLPTVYLMRRVPLRCRDGLLPAKAEIAGPSLEALRVHPGFVERAKARGHAVHVWTVNEPADVAFVVDLGVDAVITDRPALVYEQLRTGGKT